MYALAFTATCFSSRHLIALRSIPAGRAIFTECPLASGPAGNTSDDQLCVVCLRYLDHPSVCGRCFWPVCGSECGRTQRHRAECGVLAACVRQSEDEALPVRHLLVLRCLLLKNRDQYAWDKVMELEVKASEKVCLSMHWIACHFQDHHGVQTLIRSVEEELADVDRSELRFFVEDNCGIGNVDVDTVADIVVSSALDVDCGRTYFMLLHFITV